MYYQVSKIRRVTESKQCQSPELRQNLLIRDTALNIR